MPFFQSQNLEVVAANQHDAFAISSLILETATTQLRNEFSDDGWLLFLKLLSEDTQSSLIKNKKFYYRVVVNKNDYTNNRAIKGVLAIKDKTHLFHFFIKPDDQGKGIGKALWNAYLKDLKQDAFSLQSAQTTVDRITVNSSDFGIPFYQSLGFLMANNRQKKNGICYTPMTFSLGH